jgi:hypothetical protein
MTWFLIAVISPAEFLTNISALQPFFPVLLPLILPPEFVKDLQSFKTS